MNFFKRGIASVLRNLGKSLILLVLIFALGAVIAGAISIQQAVVNTEANLRRNMRPIVNFELDFATFLSESDDPNNRAQRISLDTIRYISHLPYVSYFNYSSEASLQSFTFEPYLPAMEGYVHSDWRDSMPEGWPDFITITGVSSAEIFYITHGSLELVEGRTFAEIEMGVANELDVIPIVMSRSRAHLNDLFLGSTFTLPLLIPYHNDNPALVNWNENDLFTQQTYTFEIVGLFDLTDRRLDLFADNVVDEEEHRRQNFELNELYVPSWAVEMMQRYSHEETARMINETGIYIIGIDPTAEFEASADAIFILDDPLYLDAFRESVTPLIPPYHVITDLTSNFASISTSMETMIWITDSVLIAAIIATILILSLVLILFLRVRRYEMGIYLALGEKKRKIIFQIMLEVTTIAVIGITMALFVGHLASGHLSQTMLRNELVARESEYESGMRPSMTLAGGRSNRLGFGLGSYLESLRFAQQMPVAEMMDAFDASLNEQTIIIFYGVGISIVIVSIVLPVIYITQINPKKILLEAKS